MKMDFKAVLLVGAVSLVGATGLAFSQVDGPVPPDGPMQGLMRRERLADRLVNEFDTNHDGKVTHAEFNSVLGSRFAAATHGAKLMGVEQFLVIHQPDFANHTAEMFRRIDWNGDGRLTLEEFSAPQRAHFEMMDHDGSGTVSCALSPADYRPSRSPAAGREPDARSRKGSSGFGRARFCSEADLSRDGKVTRAEFNTITAKEFSAASGGAATMTLQQFTAEEAARFRDMNANMFKRLDTDGDGKLTLAEFAAPSEKLFDRLDRNHDGTIMPDEMKPRFRGRDRSYYYPKTGVRNRRP